MVTGDFDTWLPNQTLKKHNKQQILQSQSGSTCPFPKRITNTYKFATAKTRVQFNFRKRHIILTRTMKSMKPLFLFWFHLWLWYPARCSSCFYPPSAPKKKWRTPSGHFSSPLTNGTDQPSEERQIGEGFLRQHYGWSRYYPRLKKPPTERV